MTGDERLKKFNDLLEGALRLKAVKCRYKHERVLYDRQTALPISKDLVELGYERIGFCPAKIRRERIACGHTMARYTLDNALLFLASCGVETEKLTAELQAVTNDIHSLDHEKGFAESRLAKAIEKSLAANATDLSEEIEAAKTDLDRIECLHDECVDKIDAVRNSIVDEMRLLARTF